MPSPFEIQKNLTSNNKGIYCEQKDEDLPLNPLQIGITAEKQRRPMISNEKPDVLKNVFSSRT